MPLRPLAQGPQCANSCAACPTREVEGLLSGLIRMTCMQVPWKP